MIIFKKNIIIFFIWSLILGPTYFVQCQLVHSIALKGGIVNTNQSWQYIQNGFSLDTRSKTALNIGINAERIQSKHLTLLADISYINKGHKIFVTTAITTNPNSDQFIELENNFHYLSVSIMPRAYYQFGKFNCSIFGGPRFDYLLSYSSYSGNDPRDGINKFIFGANIGMGIGYRIKQFEPFIESQYQIDFTDAVYIPSSPPNNLGVSVRNRAILASVGVKYYLSNK